MSEPTSEPVADVKPQRLVSLDAYRGFIMLAMASGGLHFSTIARQPQYQDSPLWQFLGYQFDHVQWSGCAFWDLIQPSFMFMVGVSMPYSVASRKARGESSMQIAGHTVVRSLVLIFLGIFLSSNWAKETNWIFTNVLTQIGLGYCFLSLLLGRGRIVQFGALFAILIGYWLFFALAPLPESEVDLARVGDKPEWHEKHDYTGFLAHWNKNTNAGADADRVIMNWFPRSQPFVFNAGGYTTLNFIPSLATMLFGLMAGELLRSGLTPNQKCNRLVLAGALCVSLGCVLDQTVCPSVKRIWTPSWGVFSTGWTFWMLAAFYWIIDLHGWKRWSFPLVVVGMNSIAAYCMSQLLKPWTRDTLKTHFGQDVFKGTYFGHEVFPAVGAPVAESAAFLAVIWIACWWMYRQKVFFKI